MSNSDTELRRRNLLRSGSGLISMGIVGGVSGCISGNNVGGTTSEKNDIDDESSKIKIGMSRSSTGDFVESSLKGYRGVKLWIDDLNKDGGLKINGKKRKLELITYDDRSSKSRTKRAYERLATEDNVDILFGPFSSGLTATAAAVANKNDIFFMAWAATDPKIYNQGYDNLISMDVPNNLLMKAMYPTMSDMGANSIALLYLDSPFPASLADSVKTHSEKGELNGLELVHTEPFAPNTKGFSTTLRKIKSKDPDILIISSFNKQIINIVNQMRETDISFNGVFTTHSQEQEIFEAVGQLVNYFMYWQELHSSLKREVDHGYNPQEFIPRYNDVYQRNPGFLSGNAYSSGIVLEKCMEDAGTISDVKKLRSAAEDLSGNFTVLVGDWNIDPDTGAQKTARGQFFTAQNQNVDAENYYDKFEVIGPKEHTQPTTEPVYPMPDWKDR